MTPELTKLKVAGNGLLHRRAFLRAGLLASTAAWSTAAMAREPWMNHPGAPMSDAGQPAQYESHVQRVGINSQPGTVGSGASRTPLEMLEGIITPSRLHFERHHAGIPQIDPTQHRLYIHGMVEQPLVFDLDMLGRYPTVSRIQFLECSGNSGVTIAPEPVQGTCGELHGLISCSEWGGVPISALLEEAGVKPEARWVVAGGADAAVMARSVPLDKMLDDALLALYQNGERLRPANGYPMRLFLPGWEGNASVKWLRTLFVTDQPALTQEETAKYTDLLPDGRAQMFTFDMAVKSVITSPSPGRHLTERGIYPIHGIAWSGAGKITSVEVSADGGKTWAQAQLDDHVLDKSLTRFRIPWHWQGQPAILMSRAIDQSGAVQPTRSKMLQRKGAGSFYHINAIQAWAIDEQGRAVHTYA